MYVAKQGVRRLLVGQVVHVALDGRAFKPVGDVLDVDDVLTPNEENAMPKYMPIMRGTDDSNAAAMANIEEMMATTRQFIEEMLKAGVLLAAEGLDAGRRRRDAWRLGCAHQRERSVLVRKAAALG